ncbi:MAG: calcium-translocating P-type ATPase, SERCA-type [Deltaproteobacteria bacterium]
MKNTVNQINLNNKENNISKGLTTKTAQKNLDIYGPNEIASKKKKSPLMIFIRQFSDFMVIILLLATLFSISMGEIIEASTIMFIILLNAILGFWQEFKTEKTLEALKQLAAPVCAVIRDGTITTVPASEIVPGDVIVLESGNRVPADAILIEANSLSVDESMLTGESLPVLKKSITEIPDEKPETLENHEESIFMGTLAVSGTGRAIIVNTGMNTEMGKIAEMIQNVQEELTPLQKKLDRMGTHIVYGCIIICALVSFIGMLKGEELFNMILSGISLAVAAIPEGLPAVVTISLAIGVQRMLRRNALIRKLPAVETLGCTTVICSDKTGTLTENKMTVKKIYVNGEFIDVTGSGFTPEGSFISGSKTISPKNNRLLIECLTAGTLCNNSRLVNTSNSLWEIQGDPTEGAILVAAGKAGITNKWLSNIYKRTREIPFDSDRKMMSVIYKNNHNRLISYSKGAPDVIIKLCKYALKEDGFVPMSSNESNEILKAASLLASQALRVIAIAKKPLNISQDNESSEGYEIENNLTFIGLVGMIDPPRSEALFSVQKCKKAGIRPVMITGDHKETAFAIAKEIGIADENPKTVITGEELDKISDSDFIKNIHKYNVFARVSPRHKFRIVKTLKSSGNIVAMTGDGVNDSPAVKEADIGIAMGISGTDVTKESSSIILLDDNFSTIVSAIEEGRGIYENIRKFIRYMLSCNIGEVLTMFLGSLLSSPVPLLPIQILWVNLVTDGLPGIALGLDPSDRGIMEKKPRSPNENVFSDGLLGKILFRGTIIGLSTLAVFYFEYFIFGNGIMIARTAAFATLVISQLIHVFECRSEKKDIFEINLLENKYLVWSVAVSAFMLFTVLYVPILQTIFKTTTLGISDWLLVTGFSLAGPALASIGFSLKSKVK